MHSIQTNGKYPGFFLVACIFFCLSAISLPAQQPFPENYPVIWNSQSKNSAESMPCGGGDIGLNVWVENGDLYFYMSRSGSFDENNALLKAGRVRVKLYPNPFAGQNFRQELVLQDGYVKITGSNGNLSASVDIWVDVFRPAIHVDVSSNRKIGITASYESWRHQDRNISGKQNNATSWKWAPPRQVVIFKDSIDFKNNSVVFFHRNRDTGTVFDATVRQQQLGYIKDQLYNPLHQLTFGGMLQGVNMAAAESYAGEYMDHDFKAWSLASRSHSRKHHIAVILHTDQSKTSDEWYAGLQKTVKEVETAKNALTETRNWWKQYWQRSFVYINPGSKDTSAGEWQAGRNYQLFRYMLGCNVFGKFPTKFNGGLFTYDPRFTDSTVKGTPDHRNWGGGTHVAMNQRLVHHPMLKNGDFDLMKPQFDFYMRILRNAELRSEVYWQHKGACFTEQMENFGLPNFAEYGTKRPAGFDAGMEYNAWLEYEWDTVLEFCWMMLETARYTGKDISDYVPFIESCLRFFNEHYQYLAKKRGNKAFDGNGDLVLYPGSAGETYKMAYNATSTIAALKTVLAQLLELPLSAEKKQEWQTMLDRIPPISFRTINGHTTIAPALHWERINNTESMQLYPLFPWGIYGTGKPGLDIALNTWKHDTDAIKFRSHIGWKQDNIFAARLGLASEAAALTVLKLKNSGRRFPAFWGPGYDWTPDHNWGGTGMIGLQEMLLQIDGKKIMLFPAWPKEWDVHFKLHAPYNTTVEAVLKNGKIEKLVVTPEERKQDVVNMF